MKSTVLLFALFISAIGFAQQPTKKGTHKQYITKTNDTIRVGDTISIGLPYNGNEFMFITQGNARTSSHISGDEVVITKLESLKANKTNFKMYALFKGYGLIPVHVDLENAIKTGEIEL